MVEAGRVVEQVLTPRDAVSPGHWQDLAADWAYFYQEVCAGAMRFFLPGLYDPSDWWDEDCSKEVIPMSLQRENQQLSRPSESDGQN